MIPKMTHKMTPKMAQLVSPVSHNVLIKFWPTVNIGGEKYGLEKIRLKQIICF